MLVEHVEGVSPGHPPVGLEVDLDGLRPDLGVRVWVLI